MFLYAKMCKNSAFFSCNLVRSVYKEKSDESRQQITPQKKQMLKNLLAILTIKVKSQN